MEGQVPVCPTLRGDLFNLQQSEYNGRQKERESMYFAIDIPNFAIQSFAKKDLLLTHLIDG
jgi:hypothetical protein